jgi:hypothetical protein
LIGSNDGFETDVAVWFGIIKEYAELSVLALDGFMIKESVEFAICQVLNVG